MSSGWRKWVLWCALGWVLAPATSRAEMGVFNVPNSEITKPDRLMVQEQLVFSRESAISNFTFSTGIDENWEAGLNLFNLRTSKEDHAAGSALSPLVMANFQRGVPLSEEFSLGLGTLIGTNPFGDHLGFANFTYLNTVFKPWQNTRFVFGGYFANRNFVGAELVNFMVGMELPLTREVYLMAEHTHGKHELGNSIVGFNLFLDNDIALSLGSQIPNSGSGNPPGAVLELTIF